MGPLAPQIDDDLVLQNNRMVFLYKVIVVGLIAIIAASSGNCHDVDHDGEKQEAWRFFV